MGKIRQKHKVSNYVEVARGLNHFQFKINLDTVFNRTLGIFRKKADVET